ncbi:MAG: carbamoyl-phosphate synthase large subunit, partial [Peptostreptococcaceae bacterium]|nr:carbamoyl-phosphate synthase large subunit [Peptostreptococcaceae bacterium]
EMKSTGEVLGIGKTYEEALFKGFLGAGMYTKAKGKVIMATINDADKKEFLNMAKELHGLGFEFVATSGTAKALNENGVPAKTVNRIGQESPTLLDMIVDKEINLLVNTPTKGNDSKRDGFILRRSAIERNIDVMTSLDTLRALLAFEKQELKIGDLDIYDLY